MLAFAAPRGDQPPQPIRSLALPQQQTKSVDPLRSQNLSRLPSRRLPHSLSSTQQQGPPSLPVVSTKRNAANFRSSLAGRSSSVSPTTLCDLLVPLCSSLLSFLDHDAGLFAVMRQLYGIISRLSFIALTFFDIQSLCVQRQSGNHACPFIQLPLSDFAIITFS